MVVEYGFSSKLGAIKWADTDDQSADFDGLAPHKYSERTAEVIDEEVLGLVETAHTEAWNIINATAMCSMSWFASCSSRRR